MFNALLGDWMGTTFQAAASGAAQRRAAGLHEQAALAALEEQHRLFAQRSLGFLPIGAGPPRMRVYCRGCGAPGEPVRCSYCLTPNGGST